MNVLQILVKTEIVQMRPICFLARAIQVGLGQRAMKVSANKITQSYIG